MNRRDLNKPSFMNSHSSTESRAGLPASTSRLPAYMTRAVIRESGYFSLSGLITGVNIRVSPMPGRLMSRIFMDMDGPE